MQTDDLIKEYPNEPGINYIHWLELELVKTRDENKRLRRSVSWARSLIPPSSSEAREWRSQAIDALQGVNDG